MTITESFDTQIAGLQLCLASAILELQEEKAGTPTFAGVMQSIERITQTIDTMVCARDRYRNS